LNRADQLVHGFPFKVPRASASLFKKEGLPDV
jgi:hypothetical protein